MPIVFTKKMEFVIYITNFMNKCLALKNSYHLF